MKISAASVLAISMASLVALPASRGEHAYSCMVEGDYEIKGTEYADVEPSYIADLWATARLMQTYNSMHSGDDFELMNANLESYMIERETGLEDPDGKLGYGSYNLYYSETRARGYFGCYLCSLDDDYWPYPGDKPTLRGGAKLDADALGLDSSHLHEAWEAAWCRTLASGPYSVFHGVANCTISIYDCTEEMAGTFAEAEMAKGKMEDSLAESFVALVGKVAADLVG